MRSNGEASSAGDNIPSPIFYVFENTVSRHFALRSRTAFAVDGIVEMNTAGIGRQNFQPKVLPWLLGIIIFHIRNFARC